MQTKPAVPGTLVAGVAQVDITNRAAGPVHDPLFVKALVLGDGASLAVIVTVDAVAIAEIGSIRNDYLDNVRTRLHDTLAIDPAAVIVNASHCHGAVCADVADRTVQAVTAACNSLVPVRVGAGTGHEDRIMENRRLRLRDGSEADARRAYPLPPDEEVVGVGPVDPEIGILRLDRENGQPLAVVYTFSCHPIQGVPGGGTTADLVGFASKVVEDSVGAVALFLQGCAGDINPTRYKDVENPPDAEALGNRLGLSVVRALRGIRSQPEAGLKVFREIVELPREDLAPHIERQQEEQTRLLASLRPTDINCRTFLHLLLKQRLSPDFPSYYSHRYLHDRAQGQDGLDRLDARNREGVAQYLANVHTMERLTRVQTNLALLKLHHAQNQAAGTPTLRAEVVGLRVGEFVLVTFPGELSVEIGLGIKQRSPHDLTFVAGVTNGYIYYAPTSDQLRNRGGAQEDSDCLLAPEWQARFEDTVANLLARL